MVESVAGEQQYVISLVGYAGIPGCAGGELDLVAIGVPAVGTCTLILAKPVISGAGCDNVVGDGGTGSGVGLFGGHPELSLTVTAELAAVGADGSRVTRTGSCSGTLGQFGNHRFRCAL